MKKINFEDGTIWEGKSIKIEDRAAYTNVKMSGFETINRKQFEKMLKKSKNSKKESTE